jgi:regulatory protein
MVPRITGLEAQKKRKDRVNVYLDGSYGFSVTARVGLSLKIGQDLDGAAIAALEREDAVESAYDRSLHFLSFRPRSCFEVDKYLQGKRADPNIIEEVIARLSRTGLLDDAAFAQYWVENRETFRPRGAWALRHELRRKGIADDIISEALEGLDLEESAYRAARRKAGRVAHLDDQAFRRQVGDYLRRRGFSYEVIRPVVDRLWDEARRPDGDGVSA